MNNNFHKMTDPVPIAVAKRGRAVNSMGIFKEPHWEPLHIMSPFHSAQTKKSRYKKRITAIPMATLFSTKPTGIFMISSRS